MKRQDANELSDLSSSSEEMFATKGNENAPGADKPVSLPGGGEMPNIFGSGMPMAMPMLK